MQYSDIKLQRDSSMPLFLQLADALKILIAQTEPGHQEKLLSERKLAGLLQINRMTVRRAYDELTREGIIEYHSARIRQVSSVGRRKYINPLPCIGILLVYEFSRVVEYDHQRPLQYFKGIFDRAAEKNIAVALLQLPDANSPASVISSFIKNTVNRVSGLIHIGDRRLYPDSSLQKMMRCKDIPQVIISADTASPHITQILPDISTGAEETARALVSLNIKRAGIVSFYEKWYPQVTKPYFVDKSIFRARIFRDTFEKYGITCDEKFCFFNCHSYPDVLKNLLHGREQGKLPELFWCQNDQIAMWFIRACGEIGLSVPEDVSVIGFDGIESPEFSGLATVKMPFYEIGAKAVEVLQNAITSGDFSPQQVSVDTRFVPGTTLRAKNSQQQQKLAGTSQYLQNFTQS